MNNIQDNGWSLVQPKAKFKVTINEGTDFQYTFFLFEFEQTKNHSLNNCLFSIAKAFGGKVEELSGGS